jgi:hypothetical protein
MAIDFKILSDNEVYINDKLVTIDNNGTCTVKLELTTRETETLHRYLKSKHTT